jgi:hypothetical protein
MGFIIPIITIAAWLCLAGCESGTEGRAVRFDLAIGSVAEDGDPGPGVFETATGWRVVLDEARIALGPVYLYADAMSLARRIDRVLVPVARAHGGTDPYAGRTVRGEMLDVLVLDALSRERVSFRALPGRAGRVESVRVDLAGLPNEEAAALRGHDAWVRGFATRGDERVSFAGGLDIPGDGLTANVEGIPCEGFLDEGALVTLDVRLRAWFDAADFARLPPADAEGMRLIQPDSQVRNAWYLGARSLAGYVATITP